MITIRYMPTLFDILEPHVPSRIGVFPYPEYRQLATIYRPSDSSLKEWVLYQCAEMSKLRCWRNKNRPGKDIKRGRCSHDEMVVLIRR